MPEPEARQCETAISDPAAKTEHEGRTVSVPGWTPTQEVDLPHSKVTIYGQKGGAVDLNENPATHSGLDRTNPTARYRLTSFRWDHKLQNDVLKKT